MTAEHSFDRWNYDDVPRATWTWTSGYALLERCGQIGWSWFDSHPSYYGQRLVEQSFDNFLDVGPSPLMLEALGNSLRNPPQPIVAQIREHLLARRPGRSTYVTARARVADPQARATWLDWSLDGALIGFHSLGPDGLATRMQVEATRTDPIHVLVDPGTHCIEVKGSAAPVRKHGYLQFSGKYRFAVDRASCVRLLVRATVDADTGHSSTAWEEG